MIQQGLSPELQEMDFKYSAYHSAYIARMVCRDVVTKRRFVISQVVTGELMQDPEVLLVLLANRYKEALPALNHSRWKNIMFGRKYGKPDRNSLQVIA